MGDVQRASDWATGARGRQATSLSALFIPPSDEQHLQAPGDRLTYDDLPHTPPPSMPKHKGASVTVLMQLGPRVSAVPKRHKRLQAGNAEPHIKDPEDLPRTYPSSCCSALAFTVCALTSLGCPFLRSTCTSPSVCKCSPIFYLFQLFKMICM